MSLCYPPGPLAHLDLTERESAKICSGYSYVFEAMAEGLKEILAGRAQSRIPSAVLNEAQEFLKESLGAVKETSHNPVRSSCLWARVNEAVQILPSYRTLNCGGLSEKVTGLISLIEELKGIKAVPESTRESYSILHEFAQRMYELAERDNRLLRISDTYDE